MKRLSDAMIQGYSHLPEKNLEGVTEERSTELEAVRVFDPEASIDLLSVHGEAILRVDPDAYIAYLWSKHPGPVGHLKAECELPTSWNTEGLSQ